MPSHRNQSFRNGLSAAGSIVALITTLVSPSAFRMWVRSRRVIPLPRRSPPPLPNGSAHVNVKAGMSDEDWEKAYKETGRPKFSKKSVSKSNGNVERE